MDPELDLTITDADLDRMEVALSELDESAGTNGTDKTSVEDAPEGPRLDN